MKNTIISIVLGISALGGVYLLGSNSQNTSIAQVSNTTMVDGKQVIEITAKGGYSPTSSAAKANTPTVLKVTTRSTFDCSATLNIPALGYRTNLPATGETLVDIPAQQPDTILQGTCGMGMYNFNIKFN